MRRFFLLFALISCICSKAAADPETLFAEGFDNVTAPALPPGWAATNNPTGGQLWTTSSLTPDTPPNDAFIDDPSSISDKRLDSPAIVIASASAKLTFRHSYNLESTFDGGVLEVSIGGGPFIDILVAGGSFVSGGYNASISTMFQSPIAGRMAWTGNSTGYITTTVNLGSSVAGQTIKLRWRMASDNSVAATGWRVDSISLSETTNANLSNLILSVGAISPAFNPNTTSYTLVVPASVTSTTVRPTAAETAATIRVNGQIVASGSLSNPINLNLGTNVINTVVTSPDGTATRTYTVTVTRGPPIIVSPLALRGIAGQQLTYQYITVGATSLAVNNVPTGLSFDSDVTAIVGMPSNPGTFQVGLSASNSAGTTNATLTLTIQPAPASGPVIVSSTSMTAKVNQPFTFQVVTTGGTAAARLSTSALPAGLAFNAMTGVISGTPTTEGSFAVTLTVIDGPNTVVSGLQLTFTSNSAIPVIISPTSASVTVGQPFFYAMNAPSTAPPSDPTFFDRFYPLPAGLGFNSGAGTISGTYNPGGLDARQQPDLSGGIVTNTQLFACNSQGCGTIPLNFFTTPTGAVNISTRLAVGTGDNALIAGFIIIGNAPKQVLVRGIGPSLPVPGPLQDPILELHDSDGSLLGTNDNWRDTQEDEITATGLAPTDNRESAILAILDSSAQGRGYTAIVRGTNNTTGVALVEAFDLGTASFESSSNSKLVNISTRGFVQTGDNVMIGGFIISGTPTRVIVRAIGPELTARGVPGALQDTTLELRDSAGTLVASSDDWRNDGQAQQIIDTGLAPTDDRESAIIATLNPGGYTGILRGKNNTTGAALVEVFSLP